MTLGEGTFGFLPPFVAEAGKVDPWQMILGILANTNGANWLIRKLTRKRTLTYVVLSVIVQARKMNTHNKFSGLQHKPV